MLGLDLRELLSGVGVGLRLLDRRRAPPRRDRLKLWSASWPALVLEAKSGAVQESTFWHLTLVEAPTTPSSSEESAIADNRVGVRTAQTVFSGPH
jgi:hypothetical protein